MQSYYNYLLIGAGILGAISITAMAIYGLVTQPINNPFESWQAEQKAKKDKEESERVAYLDRVNAENAKKRDEQMVTELALSEAQNANLFLMPVVLPLMVYLNESGQLRVELKMTQAMSFNVNQSEHYDVEKEIFTKVMQHYIMEAVKAKASRQKAS